MIALQSRCEDSKYRAANKKRCKEHYERNKAKYIRSAREWTRKNRFKAALSRCNTASRSRGYSECTATSDEIQAAFNGKCSICNRQEKDGRRKLCLDHDHKTGKFRGWLCENCNRALGQFEDNPNILRKAADYVCTSSISRESNNSST